MITSTLKSYVYGHWAVYGRKFTSLTLLHRGPLYVFKTPIYNFKSIYPYQRVY